jgi:hypothetical protein
MKLFGNSLEIWTLPFFRSEKVRKFELLSFFMSEKARKVGLISFLMAEKDAEIWTFVIF